MNTEKRRISAGSTPISANAGDISVTIDTNSPIAPAPITTGTKRRLSFTGADSDSDEEVIFTKQANKRKKMSDKEEIKMWFREEIGDKLDKITSTLVATNSQMEALMADMVANTAKTAETTREMSSVKRGLRNLEDEMELDRRSFEHRVRKIVNGTAGPSSAGSTWSWIAVGNSAGPSGGASFSGFSGKANNANNHERTQFIVARKSARFWPIEGKTVEEMTLNLKKFCHGALDCPERGFGNNLSCES